MTLASSPPATDAPPQLAPQDLAEVLQAYSAVAERLQESHVALQGEVERLQDELARKNEQLERGKRLAALARWRRESRTKSVIHWRRSSFTSK